MTPAIRKDIAIVIPARNEAARIGACLAALAGPDAERAVVVLAINNTADATAARARAAARRAGLALRILTCRLTGHQGVGAARNLGGRVALRDLPGLRFILTTDADCVAGPDWIARNLRHLREVDILCGHIQPMAAKSAIFQRMDMTLATHEGRYRRLVQQLYARFAPGCADLLDSHGEAAGASLALRRSAWLALGGFDPVTSGEDRQLVRRARQAGLKVRHAGDVVVQASCRLDGRARGGMAQALKDRLDRDDYRVDDCLPDAEWLVRNAAAGTLGPWPPCVPDRARLRAGDLPRHIAILDGFLTTSPRGSLAGAPALGPGAPAASPDGEQAPARARSNLRPASPLLGVTAATCCHDISAQAENRRNAT